MSLLPSRGPDVSTAQEGEMQVIGVDEDVEPLLDALASDTARAVLNAIYDEPGTPSQIADRLDMSIQKVSYHLDKLADQDLIAVAGTRYSEKGQEMKVYEPPEEPLVLFVGTEERKSSLKSLVERLLPTVGILALASVALERFLSRSGGLGLGTSSSAGGAGDGGSDGGEYQVSDATETTTEAGGDVGLTGMSEEAATERAGDATASPPTGATQETAQATGTPADAATETGRETATGMEIEMETSTEVATETVADAGGGNVSAQGVEATQTPTEISTEAVETTARATEAAATGAGVQISPGLAFFLGGLLVLTVLVGLWAYRTYA